MAVGLQMGNQSAITRAQPRVAEAEFGAHNESVLSITSQSLW